MSVADYLQSLLSKIQGASVDPEGAVTIFDCSFSALHAPKPQGNTDTLHAIATVLNDILGSASAVHGTVESARDLLPTPGNNGAAAPGKTAAWTGQAAALAGEELYAITANAGRVLGWFGHSAISEAIV